jgi:hypothetical protein
MIVAGQIRAGLWSVAMTMNGKDALPSRTESAFRKS